MPRFFRSLSLVAALSALFPAAARNTIFVSQAAPGDVHDGKTWGTAYLTIEDALAAAQAGDEVWVAAGVYRPMDHNGASGVALPAGIRLYGGFAGDETRLDQRAGGAIVSELRRPGSYGVALTIPAAAGTDTVLDGFTITAQVTVWGSPTISHNIFAPGLSPLSTPPREDTLGMVRCQSGSPVVVDNIFTGAGDVAIDCGSGSPVIVNNTIAGNGTGISLYGAFGHPTVSNNIIASCSVGMYAADMSRVTIRSNCFHANALADVVDNDSVAGADGNISADPGFASYDLANLHIQPGSPCVDAGDDAAVVGDGDVDLQPRVIGAHVDIGADESDGRAWTAEPVIVRVAPDGDDAADGSSWATAKHTLQAAVDAAAGRGGEVWVRAGTYAQHATATSHGSIRLPACVKVFGGFAGTEAARSARDIGRNETILENLDGYPVIEAPSGYRNSALDGFTVHGTATNPSAPESIIVCRNGSPVLANNTFTAAAGGGPLVSGVYTSFLFQHNSVTGMAPVTPLVDVRFSKPEFRNNVFQGNHTSVQGGIVHLDGCLGVIFRDNLFASNTSAHGVALWTVSAIVDMVNNTFVHHAGALIGFDSARGSVYANNIFAFNNPAIQTLPAYAPVRDNCFFPAGFTEDAHGNLGLNPRFVDADHGDYRLRSDSPCVDAGDTSLVLPGETDLAANLRVEGGGVDMGAYESAAAVMPGVLDAVHALQIAGGLRAATPEDMGHLDLAPPAAIDENDALALLLRLAH